MMKRLGWCLILLLGGGGLLLVAENPHAGPDGWQPPPPPKNWTAQEHHGYMDGVEAAWIDLAGHLPPKPSRHPKYQHPRNVPVSRQYWYREGYRKGYQVVYRHERGNQGQEASNGGRI